jgi:dUTPase
MKKISSISKFFIKKLTPEAVLPKKGTVGAAGYDLSSI